MSKQVNQRFKDVLLALMAATNKDVSLSRLQLQKFIYLADVFSGVWRRIAKPPDFIPYLRGPYDNQIQNAVDALSFRGFVSVDYIDIRGIRETASSYSLTAAGKIAVGQLIRHPVLLEESELFEEIAKEVARRGWNQIKEIVYSEPTYYFARTSEDRRALSINEPDRNQTEQLALFFRRSWLRTCDSMPTREYFVQTMFLVLDKFRASKDRDI